MTFVTLPLLGCLAISCAFTLPRAATVLRGVDVSYGLYLYHMPAIATMHYAGVMGSAWLWLPAYLGPLALALCSWFGVERRALRMKGYFNGAGHKPAISEMRSARSSVLAIGLMAGPGGARIASGQRCGALKEGGPAKRGGGRAIRPPSVPQGASSGRRTVSNTKRIASCTVFFQTPKECVPPVMRNSAGCLCSRQIS
jgi:hypothetical protein